MNTNTLKDIFVPYEIAEKLKEIGFDEECIAVYSEGKLHIFNPFEGIIQWVLFEGEVEIPTYEQIFKWFRDKSMLCKIENYHNSYWGYQIETINRGYSQNDFKTYEKAREQLILKLIEIYKNEQNAQKSK